jgi:hypothetical protein
MQSTIWSKSCRVVQVRCWAPSQPFPYLWLQGPSCEYLLSRALGHTLRDGVDLVDDLHTSLGHTYKEDPEIGSSQVQGQEVPSLCGGETLSARTELVQP